MSTNNSSISFFCFPPLFWSRSECNFIPYVTSIIFLCGIILANEKWCLFSNGLKNILFLLENWYIRYILKDKKCCQNCCHNQGFLKQSDWSFVFFLDSCGVFFSKFEFEIWSHFKYKPLSFISLGQKYYHALQVSVLGIFYQILITKNILCFEKWNENICWFFLFKKRIFALGHSDGWWKK